MVTARTHAAGGTPLIAVAFGAEYLLLRPIAHFRHNLQILEVLQCNGWNTSAMRSYITDVGFVRERVRRAMGGAEPPQRPYPPNDPTGVHRFGLT